MFVSRKFSWHAFFWALAGWLLLNALSAVSALAQNRSGWGHGSGWGHEHGWEFDSRYHHDHYYPVRGSFVAVLPVGCNRVVVGRSPYFFYGGAWFRPWSNGYVVVDGPWGAVVPALPAGYSVVWIGSAAYYYANGIYYSALADGQYQVMAPPVGAATAQTASPTATSMPEQAVPSPAPRVLPAGDGLYVYPRQNQSDLQAANDRHACDLWAQQQTGYNFEKPDQADPNRFDDFQRAAITCLDARGYSAR